MSKKASIMDSAGGVDGENVIARESVVLKGGRYGVSIVIKDGADLATVIAELREKLAPARNFFRGAPVCVDAKDFPAGSEERHELEATLKEFGLTVKEVAKPEKEKPQRRRISVTKAPFMVEGDANTLLHKRTLRSGQRIDYEGSVVILGDVNPGAVIACTGDIVVFGTLRGMAHAGAHGNLRAIVAAFRLQPTQLRIGHLISRAPDDEQVDPSGPEVALVKDESIVIERFSA